MNLGQVKALAKPFYDRITNAALSNPYVTNALPLGMTNIYPWTTTTDDDRDYAGQLKYLFSFDFDRVTVPINEDSDHDSLPDWWEIANFGDLNQTADGDYDADGTSNLQEYLSGSDPNNVRFTMSFVSVT